MAKAMKLAAAASSAASASNKGPSEEQRERSSSGWREHLSTVGGVVSPEPKITFVKVCIIFWI